MTSSPEHVDLLVVGAGVVGLAHAARALDAGLRVLVIDRDHAPNGASVRNFGHVGVTLQAGELGELSRASRETWLRLGERAGIPVRQTGTVVLAETDTEVAVLTELADAAPDEIALLTEKEVVERTGVTGRRGAFFPHDLRVDPRTAVPTLARWVAEQENAQVRWSTSYLGRLDADTVRTSRGDVRADRVLVCVGHDVDQLEPTLAAERDVQRCRLQMALVDTGLPPVEPALLTATSMLRYSAFAAAPSFAALREQSRERLRDLLGIDANLMMTTRPDGTVLLGDSHVTSPDAPAFLDESTSQTLLDAAASLLGARLRVVQRWQGVYATSSQGPWLVHDLDPRTTVVSVTTGLGMTISHGLAARTRL